MYPQMSGSPRRAATLAQRLAGMPSMGTTMMPGGYGSGYLSHIAPHTIDPSFEPPPVPPPPSGGGTPPPPPPAPAPGSYGSHGKPHPPAGGGGGGIPGMGIGGATATPAPSGVNDPSSFSVPIGTVQQFPDGPYVWTGQNWVPASVFQSPNPNNTAILP